MITDADVMKIFMVALVVGGIMAFLAGMAIEHFRAKRQAKKWRARRT